MLLVSLCIILNNSDIYFTFKDILKSLVNDQFYKVNVSVIFITKNALDVFLGHL